MDSLQFHLLRCHTYHMFCGSCVLYASLEEAVGFFQRKGAVDTVCDSFYLGKSRPLGFEEVSLSPNRWGTPLALDVYLESKEKDSAQ